MEKDFVWVFVEPGNPYNFAMIPPTPAKNDLKYNYDRIIRWILRALLHVFP